MGVLAKWVKWWWLNRKLRGLQSDLHYMENYESISTASGVSNPQKPAWMGLAIIRAKVRIHQVQTALSALG